MKIYTKTGDKGTSSLLSGERVAKNDRRISAYGEADELNAFIGALIAALPESPPDTPSDAPIDVRMQLQAVQADLFQVGAWLATTPGSAVGEQLKPINEEHLQRIESYIDTLQEALPELKSFILPGGHPSAAWAHICRTVCRRVERQVIDLQDAWRECEENPAVPPPILVYLNRLSDYLFVLARYCNQSAGLKDVIWQGKE